MRKRNKSIPIRVTEDELKQIDKKAAKARLSRTDYLINCALGKEITLIEDIKPLLMEMRRIGNNLNQQTKLANMGKINAVNLEETLAALDRMYQVMETCSGKRMGFCGHH